VPNAVTPSNVTSRNHTQNVLKTGGGNYMVMEDQEGIENVTIYTPVGTTQLVMGKNGLFSVRAPPTAQQGGAQPEAAEFTYFVSSEGTAGFNVGGDWWQTVRGNYLVDIGENVVTHYGGTQTFRVDQASTEYYNGYRKTEMHASYFQTVEPDGEQHVKGDWTHKVTGTNMSEYGTWASTVANTWKTHAGGSITIASDASISVSAPGGQISLISPSVTVRGASVKVESPDFTETFSTAHSVGIETFDGAAFATSAVAALKLDYASTGIEYMAIKIEKTGAHAINEGTKLDGTALAIANGAVRFFSAGLVKLG
jgi:type VI secretion system secreted protein VgrG